MYHNICIVYSIIYSSTMYVPYYIFKNLMYIIHKLYTIQTKSVFKTTMGTE